jgi:hypothetical protein
MPDRDELDRLIDSALTGYAQPRNGLEQRMLARLSGEALRPRVRRWVLAAIAVPVLTTMILLAYFVPSNLHRQPGQGQVAYTPPAPSTSSGVNVAAPQRPPKESAPRHGHNGDLAVHRAASNNAVPRPKLDVFPTVHPLSAEEQAMSRFAMEASETDRKALVEAQQKADEPVNISAIHIPPLQSLEENQH